MVKVSMNLDEKPESVEVDSDKPLLYTLSNNLNLKNPRFGCGLGQCGACTVLVDGKAVRSCVVPTVAVEGKAVTTLAGLGSAAQPHPVQQAFLELWAVQCGYCLNGWIMTTAALLKVNPNPNDAEIRQALTGLKCRCAMHHRFLRAAKRAAQISQDQQNLSGLEQ